MSLKRVSCVITVRDVLWTPGQAGLHPRPQEVDVFLAMDEHGAGVSARAGSRPIAWTTGNVSPVSTSPTVAGEFDATDGQYRYTTAPLY